MMFCSIEGENRREDPAGRWRQWPGASSTPASPTSPLHYAALELVFLAGLAAVVGIASRRERNGDPAVPSAELPVLAIATFALANLVTKEKISTWLREPFVQEASDHKPVQAEGDGMRYAIGELLTCSRCIGAWSALGLVGLRTAAPVAGRSTATILALTGINSVLQSGFRLLTERTNNAIYEAEAARNASSV
jgi:hypothetical protein